MDSDYELDLGEVRRHLNETQVVGFFFPFLRLTLLLDTRSNAADPPMAVVVPMVQSVEERIRTLRRLRPRFPRPESMTLIPWPKFVGSLERMGVWDLVEKRMAVVGGDVLIERCRLAFKELARAERKQVVSAITGAGYETMWERKAGA
jgi:hypothetical protein